MKFQCLHCNQHYEIDEKYAGCSVHCKICGNVMKVPIPLGKSVILCPEVVHITHDEVHQQQWRRKKRRYIRRILLTAISLLIGLVIGVIGHIIIQTCNMP